MSSEQRGYISYLLRLWRIRSGDELVWRASLENPHTGKRVGFANLEALVTALHQEITNAEESSQARAHYQDENVESKN